MNERISKQTVGGLDTVPAISKLTAIQYDMIRYDRIDRIG